MQYPSKCKARSKSSPYRIQTETVNRWKEQLGLSDVRIARALDCDPSTVSRHIANKTSNPKMQLAIARFFERASKGLVTKGEILMSRFGDLRRVA